MGSHVLRCILLVCLIVGSVTAYLHAAPAPSAFGRFATYGVGFAPSFTSGSLSYVLILQSDACILWWGHQYPITRVWGVFAVNPTRDEGNDFIARGSSIGAWVWNQHPISGTSTAVAGWLNASKKEALVTPASGVASKEFTYTYLSFTGASPALGLHVSVAIQEGLPSPFSSGGETGHTIPAPVPEPTSLAALILLGVGLSGLAGRKPRRA